MIECRKITDILLVSCHWYEIDYIKKPISKVPIWYGDLVTFFPRINHYSSCYNYLHDCIYVGFTHVTVGCWSLRSTLESWLDAVFLLRQMLVDSWRSCFIRRSRLQSASSERMPNMSSTFTFDVARRFSRKKLQKCQLRCHFNVWQWLSACQCDFSFRKHKILTLLSIFLFDVTYRFS